MYFGSAYFFCPELLRAWAGRDGAEAEETEGEDMKDKAQKKGKELKGKAEDAYQKGARYVD